MSGNVIEKGKKVLDLETNLLWGNTFALVSLLLTLNKYLFWGVELRTNFC